VGARTLLLGALVGAAVALAGPGCTSPERSPQGAPAVEKGGAPKAADEPASQRAPGEVGAPTRPAPDVPAPRGEAASAAPQLNIPQLSAELDHPDTNVVYHAAFELLDAREEPRAIPELERRLQAAKLESQRTIVKAIGRYPRAGSARVAASASLVEKLLPLVSPFLGNSDPGLRKEAIEAIASLDAIDPTDENDPVAKYVADVLAKPRDQGPSIPERTANVLVTGRKPPKTAVRLLISAFERSPVADVKDAARRELYRLTGQSFRGADDMKTWFEKNQDKSQDQWYQERIERIEADVALAREVARTIWNRYQRTLADDPVRFWAELESALKSSEVPQIRIDAAKRLIETGKGEAYDLVMTAAREDKDVEVRRAVLVDAVAKSPPTDPAVRARVIDGLLPLTEASEKEVRFAAVIACGALKAEKAVEPLLKRISNPQRDADVAGAALAALTEIAPRAEGTVGSRLNDFLLREIERPPSDPLRDLKLVEQGAATLGVVPWPEGEPEAERAREILVRLLESTVPSPDGKAGLDPKTTPVPRFDARTRLVAVISLSALKRPSALKDLTTALSDADEFVAAEAARAIGAIAFQKGADPRERAKALAGLTALLDSPRAALRDAALEAVSEAFRADRQNLALLGEVTDRLVAAKDFARLVKVLKDLPPKAAPEATAATRTLHMDLRRRLAEALESMQPTPDPKAALEIWADLAKESPETFAERHAFALAALPSEKADEAFAELLRKQPAAAKVDEYWRARTALAKRFVDAALDGKSKDIDRPKARALLDRLLAEKAAAPSAQRAEIDELDRRLGKERSTGAADMSTRSSAGAATGAPPTGTAPTGSTTVPGGLKQPVRTP